MLIYVSDQLSHSIVITEEVIAHFERYKQLRQWDKEAGGQLFAHFEAGRTIINLATGPRPTDERTRTSYVPKRAVEQEEIYYWYSKGLHYVGDWHTHPTKYPVPSKTDIENITSTTRNSVHELQGLILVVVGLASFPEGLRVSMHNGNEDLIFQPFTN
ncbi:MAG TPA: Mov34/MPN/PAD-1 family protein [Pyrinomonadaceae bacterium]|jgi:integrative and conjugative element protein (TIGR02256 family)